MDSSRSHQSTALKYLLNGVGPEDLPYPAERLLAVKAKLKVLAGWGPNRPGFRPLGLFVGGEGTQVKYPRGVSGKTNILQLASLESKWKPVDNLLVTLEGELLIHARKKGAAAGVHSVVHIQRCGDVLAEQFFADSWTLIHACEAINRAVESRVRKLLEELGTAVIVQRQMGKTILPRTL